MPAHRPFWIVRHRITGQTKRVAYGSVEDGMWEIILTDGSEVAIVEHEQPVRSPKEKADSRRKKRK